MGGNDPSVNVLTAHAPRRRLVLAGSVIVDLVLAVPRLPDRGGDLLASGGQYRVGGGWYVLSAAAAAGMATAFAGRHGAGPFGEQVRSALAALGTEMVFPEDETRDTGVCVVMVEPDGERTFVTSAGVEASLDESLLATIAVGPHDTIYISGYDLAYKVSGPALAAWSGTIDASACLVVDPGPLAAEIPHAVLHHVLARTQVLTLNRRERALLTGTDDATAAATAVRALLPAGGLVILRDGAADTLVTGGPYRSDIVAISTPPVKAADTTGAGDIHTGTLIARLAAGDEPTNAVRSANLAASAHVEGRVREAEPYLLPAFHLGVREGVDLTKAMTLAATRDDEDTVT